MSKFELALDIVEGRFTKEVAKLQPRAAHAATAAMRDTVDLALVKGRQSILGAGFSAKWANALRGTQYPQGKDSLDVTGFIWHKIGYAGIFESGGDIHPKAPDGMLWLPIEQNLPIRSVGSWTPLKWTQEVGPLASVERPGKPPLLVGRVPVGQAHGFSFPLHAPPIGLSPRTQARRRRFSQAPVITAPLFFGIPLVTIGPKFGVKAARDEAAKQFGRFFAAELKA